MRQVEVGYCLRNRQEAVYIVGSGNICCATSQAVAPVFGTRRMTSRLALTNGPEVTIEKLFEVVHRRAMAAVDQRGREAAQTRKANQVFRQRRKTFRRIDRIG